ncbi:RCC1 domain-containing protein [Ramlibacter albus]|uniref:Uncharacterized protein n=1 Tax=Ramlibacter albus TaxID=2079448 RepID=A0A923S420_9BURK|nr:hypothetical protein [Ramlibacter albus]MBC5766448.1 hypothetical protein [Ramlibacter albus]
MGWRIWGSTLLALAVAGCGGGLGGQQGSEAAAGARPSAQAQQATDPTTGALRVFQAFNGRAPTAAEFNAFSSADSRILAIGFAAGFAQLSDASLAASVLANLGVNAQAVNAASREILQAALTQFFAANGAAARGVIVNNLVGLLAGLESDATWGTAARAFNTTINSTRAIVAASTGGYSNCLPSVAQGFSGNVETTAASTGDAGSSGDGGSGGGAAAGGGLGKVLGGTMTVVDLSTGATVGQGITDANTGLVTIRTCSLAGPFLLTLEGRAGARYFDEGRNALLDFPAGTALHALVDRWDEHVGVSPITEAAYRYALNNLRGNPGAIAAGQAPLLESGSLLGLTAAQVRAANAVAASEINARLPDAYQLASAKTLPTPIDASSATSALPASAYGRSAAVNGGLVQATDFFNQNVAAPALSLVATLARDLTDGRIDGFALDGSAVSTTESLAYSNIELPQVGTIGANAMVTRFGRTTLLPAQPTVDKQGFVGTNMSNAMTCEDVMDTVALLSDGSVTLQRRFPTNVNGTCSFTFSAAENERVVKTRNFLTGIKAISTTGGTAGFAVKRDGTVYGWGRSFCGSIHPSFTDGLYLQPQVLPGLRNITAASTNSANTILRDDAGGVYYYGVRGGIPLNGTVPAGRARCGPVATLANGTQYTQTYDLQPQRAALANVVDVATSWSNFFALTADGVLYGWGEGVWGELANSSGQVLDGNLMGSPIASPTPIAGLGKVRQFAESAGTVYALQRDGTVMAWGADHLGLLGAGTVRHTLRPAAVPGLTSIAQMAVAYDMLRLRRFDGTFLAWGTVRQPAARYLVPTVVQPAERVRYFEASGVNFSVYMGSGKLTSDIMVGFDITDSVR